MHERCSSASFLLYPFWLTMMAFHELGHVVGAITTGGRVLQVTVPPAGFSETIVHPNPWPRVEVWCGPVLGGVAPVVLWLALRRTRAGAIVQGFAGWCLITNGAYLGLGWIHHAGDAGEFVRLGTPVSVLIAFGTVWTAAGLFLWHLLGRTPNSAQVGRGPARTDDKPFPASQDKDR